jgi:hypothetical protein
MPCPPHSPWFYLPNNIWWWVQIMKLPILQLSPFSLYFIPLRSSLRSSLNVTDQVSHPYKTTGRIMVFVYLNLYVPRQQVEGQKTVNRTVASVPGIWSALNQLLYIMVYLNLSKTIRC